MTISYLDKSCLKNKINCFIKFSPKYDDNKIHDQNFLLKIRLL